MAISENFFFLSVEHSQQIQLDKEGRHIEFFLGFFGNDFRV